MQACMEQPEYAGKTFGVISLLGDDQVKTLQEEIDRRIDTKEYIRRRILCGNASNFQGDERDVIFLSLVDCANGHGPVANRHLAWMMLIGNDTMLQLVVQKTSCG